MSANSPSDGEASSYLCSVNRQSEYEIPVSVYKYSEPLIALSEIEPVTKESLPPVSAYLSACPVCTYLSTYVGVVKYHSVSMIVLLVLHEMYWLCGDA